MPVVLGIDQSLRSSGLFWVGDDLVPHWHQVDTKELRGAERLVYIKNEVLKAVDACTPALAAMEGYSYGSRGKVFELGELGGVLKVALQERGVPTLVASPVQVKKFATGNAKAEKDEVVEAINKAFRLSWDAGDNNLADAASLALIARAYLSTEPPTVRHQAEVIAALRRPLTLSKKVKRRPSQKFHNI